MSEGRNGGTYGAGGGKEGRTKGEVESELSTMSGFSRKENAERWGMKNSSRRFEEGGKKTRKGAQVRCSESSPQYHN